MTPYYYLAWAPWFLQPSSPKKPKNDNNPAVDSAQAAVVEAGQTIACAPKRTLSGRIQGMAHCLKAAFNASCEGTAKAVGKLLGMAIYPMLAPMFNKIATKLEEL